MSWFERLSKVYHSVQIKTSAEYRAKPGHCFILQVTQGKGWIDLIFALTSKLFLREIKFILLDIFLDIIFVSWVY